MTYFFVYGMFRSGTTLIARQLDAHPNITCASDPFRPFFNAFRDSVANDLSVNCGPYDPLGDYFADDEQLKLFEEIQEGSLSQPFDRDPEQLLRRIRQHGKPFSPYVADAMARRHVMGHTFAEVLDNLLEEVKTQYGSDGDVWTGTKEVWTTEFLPLLKQEYPDSKHIIVVRDPRAVCASKYAQDSVYPWLFLIRQWRKLSLLAYKYAVIEERPDVHIVRYEDLIEDPEDISRNLCDFLSIQFDANLITPERFTDGHGEPWVQNTSYDLDAETFFNTQSISRWKDTLPRAVTEYVEALTLPEMRLFGYEPMHADGARISDNQLLSPPRLDIEDFAGWIKPYYDNRSSVSVVNEMAKEHARIRLLAASESTLDHVDRRVKEANFLDTQLLDACRSQPGWLER